MTTPMETQMVIASTDLLVTRGAFEARYDHTFRRYFVRDTRTGMQFNCNGRGHAIAKARAFHRVEVSRRAPHREPDR